MTAPYSPTDTRHASITLPSDGDPASAAFFDPPYQECADNAEVALLRHDLITVAALQALTGMPSGTSRTVKDASGYPIGTFYYDSTINNASPPFAYPFAQTDRLFIIPAADPGVWLHESFRQARSTALTFSVPVGLRLGYSTAGVNSIGTDTGVTVPCTEQNALVGVDAYFDVSEAIRPAYLESITIRWLPATGRAAVPTNKPAFVSLHVFGNAVAGATTYTLFGPSTLGGWNAGTVRNDVIAINSDLTDTAAGSPGTLYRAALHLEFESGANAVIADKYFGASFNYVYKRLSP